MTERIPPDSMIRSTRKACRCSSSSQRTPGSSLRCEGKSVAQRTCRSRNTSIALVYRWLASTSADLRRGCASSGGQTPDGRCGGYKDLLRGTHGSCLALSGTDGFTKHEKRFLRTRMIARAVESVRRLEMQFGCFSKRKVDHLWLS